jgi:hypothetical protein
MARATALSSVETKPFPADPRFIYVRRRAAPLVLLIVGVIVLLIGASTTIYQHARADFFNSGEPHCGGG